MSHQEWQLFNWESVPEPLNVGSVREKSKRTAPRAVNADTTPIQLSIFQSLSQQSYTLEFPAILRSLTLSDRYSFLSLSIPVAKSSETSVQDSTSKERVCLPYWNEFCQAMSEWLSLPTLTDYVDLGSTLLHGSLCAAAVRFWFSTTTFLAQKKRCLKMFLPSSTSSPASSTDSASTRRTLKKTLTYRVYPKGQTKKVWMLRVHACRKVYNNAIAYLNSHQSFNYINKDGDVRTGKKAFRSFCKTLGTYIIPDWCSDLGIAHALDNALFEAYSAWSKTKRGEKFIGIGKDKKPNFNFGKKIARFRSIRDKNQTIQFDPLDYKNGHWKVNSSKGLEKAEFRGQDRCFVVFDGATELTYNKGRWFANFPIITGVQNIDKGQKIIALDPGLRCFMTGFDGNQLSEFGNGDFARIAKLCQHLDHLKSKHDKKCGRQFKRLRYSLRQAMERVRTRIKNLRSEIHKQVASHLARNYDTIYLPTFETSQMVAKKKRRLKSKSARAMMTWAFYEFSQTLQHLCNRYGSRLVRVTEEYTSKTCTRCGYIHAKLGGAKNFKCPHCGYEIKRDFNGAVGIFLKALWDTTIVSTVSENDVVLDFPDVLDVGDCRG